MNKVLKFVVISFLSGLLLTAATFAVATTPPGVDSQCIYVPDPSDPLSELAARPNTQQQHGFPLVYYVDHADENCQSGNGVVDMPVNAKFKTLAAVVDLLIWSAVVAMVLYVAIWRRKND